MLSETALVTVLYGPAPVPVLGEQGPKRILRLNCVTSPGIHLLSLPIIDSLYPVSRYPLEAGLPAPV
jgi:hypothetical protein